MEFFRRNHECRHDKFVPDKDIGYCPDCGELIENRWFITRCACCGVKVKAIIKNGKIVAVDKFCHNCGAREFEVERINKINFIDINYAVLVKTVIENGIRETVQSWVDTKGTAGCRQKLLQQSR